MRSIEFSHPLSETNHSVEVLTHENPGKSVLLSINDWADTQNSHSLRAEFARKFEAIAAPITEQKLLVPYHNLWRESVSLQRQSLDCLSGWAMVLAQEGGLHHHQGFTVHSFVGGSLGLERTIGDRRYDGFVFTENADEALPSSVDIGPHFAELVVGFTENATVQHLVAKLAIAGEGIYKQ
ncbi:MAG: hypothetical protein QG629_734 [Patescibacteria group bacterium]|nr:hypothetical protein [Candidatus Saccharibacteria bacterium]MDQ5963651.1 hypothetical protein [Patescibacteria group bacterium]